MDTPDPKYLLEKLHFGFDSLICAAKLNVALDFVLKNVEGRSFRFRFAHKNKILLERSKLVATTEGMTKVKILLSNIDVIESLTRERANTKWKFYKLINFAMFAALLKEAPRGCKDTVMPDPPLNKTFRQTFRL